MEELQDKNNIRKRKVKYALLVSLVLFLILNIVLIIMFRGSIHFEFLRHLDGKYFLEDATVLVDVNVRNIFLYIPKEQQFVFGMRGVMLFNVVFLSSYLVYKERTLKNILYLCVSIFTTYIVTFHGADPTRPGIYGFLMKAKISYAMAEVDFPWILYYSVILIPIILITIIVIKDVVNSSKNK